MAEIVVRSLSGLQQLMYARRKDLPLTGIESPLTDEHVTVLGRVAARCPVHKTLTHGLVVQDTIAPRP
ncbi:MAG: hypothetical protein ACYC5Q_02575 [Thermoleophilia bacterium]